jgi:hypothetical protein
MEIIYTNLLSPFLPSESSLRRLNKNQMEPIESDVTSLVRQQDTVNVPVFRCNRDVHQYIFEFAVEDGRQGLKTATRISHVCRLWRIIALDTPKMWSCVYLSGTRGSEDTRSFLDRTLRRVRAVPVDLTLYAYPLSELKIHTFFRIRRLSATILTASSIPFTQLDPLEPLRGYGIHELELDFLGDAPRMCPWNCPDALTKFPLLRRFSLSRAYSAVFNNQTTIPSITHFCIDDMSVDLGLLAAIFRNIKELKLRNLGIIYSPTSPIIFVHLERLFVEDDIYGSFNMLGDWLEYISCPILTDLTIDQNIYNTIAFISRHPSLIFFHSCHDSVLSAIGEAAPQLRHLLVGVDRPLMDLFTFMAANNANSIPFTRLNSLIIEANCLEFSLDEFESLVITRCLPRSHPQCLRAPNVEQLRELEITFSATIPGTSWESSHLYGQAEKIIKRQGCPLVTSVKLWWRDSVAYSDNVECSVYAI